MEKITKTFEGVDLQLEEGSRTVLAIISTDSVDRDGEVIQTRGMKKKSFAGNPVVFANHDYTSLPIGKALWVKSTDNAVLSKYYVSDQTQDARDIFGLLQDGVLNAHSIGFFNLRSSPPSTKEVNARPDLKNAKSIIREWELYEFSVVGVPANQEALKLAVSKGYGKKLLDSISGNTVQVTKQIVAAVEAEPSLQKSLRSQKELRRLIANYIDQMEVVIDPDRVITAAVRKIAG